MARKKITRFTLHNGGGFVCRGRVAYEDDEGNIIVTESETGDILLGQRAQIDPAALGVPQGVDMRLDIRVVAGSDNRSSQEFLHDSGAPAPSTANYVITGTTLSNYMGLQGYS